MAKSPKTPSRKSKAVYANLKKIDPRSVVREGEMRRSKPKKKVKDPRSAVRPGEGGRHSRQR